MAVIAGNRSVDCSGAQKVKVQRNSRRWLAAYAASVRWDNGAKRYHKPKEPEYHETSNDFEIPVFL